MPRKKRDIDPDNDILGAMEKDAEEVTVKSMTVTRMKQLTKYVQSLMAHDQAIERLNILVAKETEKRTKLSTAIIPDFFDEMGLSKIALTDGSEVSIDSKYVAHIKEENKVLCFKWLKKNNHGSIIKHDVTATIKKGQAKLYTALKKSLKTLGLAFKDKAGVHSGTLNAFVNEQIQNGVELPEEFGIFNMRKTKIKN